MRCISKLERNGAVDLGCCTEEEEFGKGQGKESEGEESEGK